jgi:hypothetical protein
MVKKILFFLAASLGYFQGNAQHQLADSLRNLVQKVRSLTIDEQASCKKLSDFKTNISKIDASSLESALEKIMSANKSFLKDNKNGDCPIRDMISDLDSMLAIAKSTPPPDSADILKAILFAKYRIKDSELVLVALSVVSEKNVPVVNPVISLVSFEPAIATPFTTGDSLRNEIYIRPGTPYILTITDSGYTSYQSQITNWKDTTITVVLNTIAVSSASPDVNPAPATSQTSYWWIPAVLLALVLLAILWKRISDKKTEIINGDTEALIRARAGDKESTIQLNESITKLHLDIQEKDGLISKGVADVKNLQSQVEALSKASTSNTVVATKNTGKHFFTEMMMTAGPRKPTDESNSDGDLGEDVCGFLTSADSVFVWVLDGSSHYTCLRDPSSHVEYFSSRLLAQSIGLKLRAHFAEANMDAFDETVSTIINDIKSDWLQTINALPDSEKKVLTDNIKDGFQAQCASAILIGSLSLGGALNVYRVGDSKMFVYSGSGGQKSFVDTSLAIGKDKNYDYLFFTLGLGADGNFTITASEPKFEIIKEQNIQTVIAFSDGIGRATQDELKKEYPINTEEARKAIIYQLQGTEDDKSLCIIEIKD